MVSLLIYQESDISRIKNTDTSNSSGIMMMKVVSWMLFHDWTKWEVFGDLEDFSNKFVNQLVKDHKTTSWEASTFQFQ